jgi:hypothetical protein
MQVIRRLVDAWAADGLPLAATPCAPSFLLVKSSGTTSFQPADPPALSALSSIPYVIFHFLLTPPPPSGPPRLASKKVHGNVSQRHLRKRWRASARSYPPQLFGARGTPAFNKALSNFATSLAAYSLISYFLELRDRSPPPDLP